MFHIKRFNKKAYTYIELLGVIAVIILVVTPMLYMLNSVYDKSLKSHALTQANNVLTSVMDRARFDIKHDGLSAVRSGAIDTEQYTYYNIPSGYLVNLNISIVEDLGSVLRIEVDLTYNNINLKSKSLVYYE